MLNLNEFVRFYSNELGMPMTQAKREIENFITAFKKATYIENGVNINSFLKSEVVDIPAKKCRNPKTGAEISVPAKKIVKIKISSKFKNMED